MSTRRKKKILKSGKDARQLRATTHTSNKKKIIPKLYATHEGHLKLGEITIHCAVLNDRRRVLTTSEVQIALGRSRAAKGRNHTRAPAAPVDDQLPPFLAQNNLKPFISAELRLTTFPVSYKPLRTGRIAQGYEAGLLPAVCRVYLDARRAGALRANQAHMAERAEILIGALADVGIRALIDEATGYQYERPSDELNRILALYISKELMPWQQRFPREYYEQLYRLRGWKYSPEGNRHPRCVGQITNDIVYSRLEEGVLDELRRRNPTDDDGRRSHKHHQYLTASIGQLALDKHLTVCVALMKTSFTWTQFKSSLDYTCPRPKTAGSGPAAPTVHRTPLGQLALFRSKGSGSDDDSS